MAVHIESTSRPVIRTARAETCDGCGHLIATDLGCLVSFGPVDAHGSATERPKVFHGPRCAQDYDDVLTLRQGLRGL